MPLLVEVISKREYATSLLLKLCVLAKLGSTKAWTTGNYMARIISDAVLSKLCSIVGVMRSLTFFYPA